LAYSASFSWICAESGSITASRSQVARVVWILPLKPSATSRGSRPEWSMWAWVRMTKSIVRGSKLKARWFFSRVSRPPWNMPQSTRKRTPSASTR
jgi:hypothetical protein